MIEFDLDIDTWIDWLASLPPWKIYIAFIIIAILENITPPIPGDTLLVFGGYLSSIMIIDAPMLIILASVGSFVGFMFFYVIGRGIRNGNIHTKIPIVKNIITDENMNKVHIWITRWGFWLILFNRFLTGMRTIITLGSGYARYPIVSTMVCSYISAILWNGLLIYLGWFVGENWRALQGYIQTYGWVLVIMFVLFVLYKMINYIKKRRKNKI